MYCDIIFKTKRELREAVASGRHVGIYALGPFPAPQYHCYLGEASVEGPHYPAPHTWYARVQVKDGVITKVIA